MQSVYHLHLGFFAVGNAKIVIRLCVSVFAHEVLDKRWLLLAPEDTTVSQGHTPQ